MTDKEIISLVMNKHKDAVERMHDQFDNPYWYGVINTCAEIVAQIAFRNIEQREALCLK